MCDETLFGSEVIFIWLIMDFCPLRNHERLKQTLTPKIFFWTHLTQQRCVVASLCLMSVWIICLSADFGWWACRFRKRLSVAEPACFWVDQSAGLSLADGHEHGAVHSGIHSKGRGRSAALPSGQWQVKGERKQQLSTVFPLIHAELPAKCLSHFSAGARRDEPKRPFNHQEEAEGLAEGPGEAWETEGEKREGGSTQWEAARQHRLCLLRDDHEFRQ